MPHSDIPHERLDNQDKQSGKSRGENKHYDFAYNRPPNRSDTSSRSSGPEIYSRERTSGRDMVGNITIDHVDDAVTHLEGIKPSHIEAINACATIIKNLLFNGESNAATQTLREWQGDRNSIKREFAVTTLQIAEMKAEDSE